MYATTTIKGAVRLPMLQACRRNKAIVFHIGMYNLDVVALKVDVVATVGDFAESGHVPVKAPAAVRPNT